MEMSVVTLVTLIVSIFLLFMLSLGATSAWVAIRDRDEKRAPDGKAAAEGDVRGATKKAA